MQLRLMMRTKVANDDSGYPLKREVKLRMDPHGLVRHAQFVRLVDQG